MALRSSYLSVDYSWGQLRGGQSGVKSLTSASPAIRPSEPALEQAVRHVNQSKHFMHQLEERILGPSFGSQFC